MFRMTPLSYQSPQQGRWPNRNGAFQ